MTTKTQKPVDEMTADELKALLDQKQKEEREQRDKERKGYELHRNKLVVDLCQHAKMISSQLQAFKTTSIAKMRGFYEIMQKYGNVRKTEAGRGSFKLKSDDGQYEVLFQNHVNYKFDERAKAAEAKLKEFMGDFVRKRDRKLYDLVMSLLERNSVTGDYDIKLISRLYKMEDQFDDERWKEAIRLFKESYTEHGSAFYVRFYERSEHSGRMDLIDLNFSSVQEPAKPTSNEATTETTGK